MLNFAKGFFCIYWDYRMDFIFQFVFLWCITLIDLCMLKNPSGNSVAQSCPTVCYPMDRSMPPCPSSTPRVYPDSCPLSWWCHPTIPSSVVPFSSHLQSFPASGSFPMSEFLASGGQSIGVSASASVLPMKIQVWFPLGLTGLIFLLELMGS